MAVKKLLASQFGDPRGLLGKLVGKAMAKGNGSFNRWIVDELVRRMANNAPSRIVEIGHGPGIATADLLERFPTASVWGIDQSGTMTAAARARNRDAVKSGRAQFVTGDLERASAFAPLDLILAVHVLYFLRDPVKELAHLRGALSVGGVLALGFQIRTHMPPPAQVQFPRLGHRLYETPDEVEELLRAAGFLDVTITVKGEPGAPHGFLAVARSE